MSLLNLVNNLTLNNFLNYDEFFLELDRDYKKKRYSVINFLYWSSFVTSRKNINYKNSLQISSFILIDGIGMQIYIKKIFKKQVKDMNGTDLLPILLKKYRNQNIVFYGSKNSNIKKVYKKAKLENLNIVHYQNGYEELQWNMVPKKSILLVGKGSPIQEEWILNNIDIIKEKEIIVFGVGGFFDFYSGEVKRCPKIIKKLCLEWLYRVINNPKQHYKKNINNFKLFYFILKDGWSKL